MKQKFYLDIPTPEFIILTTNLFYFQRWVRLGRTSCEKCQSVLRGVVSSAGWLCTLCDEDTSEDKRVCIPLSSNFLHQWNYELFNTSHWEHVHVTSPLCIKIKIQRNYNIHMKEFSFIIEPATDWWCLLWQSPFLVL